MTHLGQIPTPYQPKQLTTITLTRAERALVFSSPLCEPFCATLEYFDIVENELAEVENLIIMEILTNLR